MRILFCVPAYKPAYRFGGPAVSVPALAETLVRKGHEVTVVTTNSNLDEDLDVLVDRPVDVDGVQVHYLRRTGRLKRWLPFLPYFTKASGYLYAAGMADQLDRLVPGVDVVHTHLPFVYPTYAAAKAAHRWRKPLFYHQRGVYDPQRLKFRGLKKSLYIRLVERPILRQATTLIALTPAEKESYRLLGVDTPCRVIANGIDVDAYRQRPLDDSILPAGAPLVLFLGRLHPIKGADKLLEAFVRVAGRHPSAVLVVAGPDEFELERKYRARIESAGLSHRVRFPGMVAGTRKFDLLARADLFCLPSAAEGFSMAILEALASKTAVLVSPGCHFPDLEIAGAGRIVDAEVDALTANLDELLGAPNQLASMGEAGLRLVREEYSWDHVAEQMLQAYEDGIQRFHAAATGRCVTETA